MKQKAMLAVVATVLISGCAATLTPKKATGKQRCYQEAKKIRENLRKNRVSAAKEYKVSLKEMDKIHDEIYDSSIKQCDEDY